MQSVVVTAIPQTASLVASAAFSLLLFSPD